MRVLRSHLTYANVVATLALVIAVGGGAAYAANTVFSTDIVDGEVKTPDLAANAVNSSKIADGQVTEADIGQGAVNTAELKNDAVTSQKVLNETLVGNDVAANTLKGADIDESTLDIGDVRAYARIDPDTCTGTPGTCTPEQSKGISTVTRAELGIYCVTAPGIDSNVTPAAVTVDFQSTEDPAGNGDAMTREAGGCGPSDQGFGVVTDRHRSEFIEDNTGVVHTVPGQPVETNDVGFTIVIP